MPDEETTEEAAEPAEDPRIAALITERDGYTRRGLANRVAEVDAALKSLGFKGKLGAPEEKTTRSRKAG